jgi:hypothetical protein
VRKDLFERFRIEHGMRIKADRGGASSIDLSIATRIAWAGSRWLEPCNDIVRLLNGHSSSLYRWGVLKSAPVVAEGAALGPVVVDQFLLESVETLARTFCGLTARGLSLWQGGVYFMVTLLSDDPRVREGAVFRAQRLFPRMLALEKLLAGPDCSAAVTTFGARYLWLQGTVYRELMGLLSEGHIDAARIYAWRIHGSVHHEKGHNQEYKLHSLIRLGHHLFVQPVKANTMF